MTEKEKLDRQIETLRKSVTTAAIELLETLTLEERKSLRAELSRLVIAIAELNGKL